MRALLLTTTLLAGITQAAEPVAMDVYRDPNCGCCKAWISHLRDNGIEVRDHEESNMAAVKTRLGVPYNLGSCHTGVVDGKFVEGHVPASDVLKLRERPDQLGAAVPGMPIGSPGMEMGDRHDAYQVIGVASNGQQSVLSEYPAR
ncbi:DUF411 domain-containing protein [Pseudomonas sp. Q1-7]|uniref:DUF411 domain-containing protein n=1 Tax=Pseudomonas sp. Q1-7 TaxID=3020843 RepID=UPI002301F4F6|nr:DUF411 domain-containing protein [Pseudomonas sp. Q1-7]